jgi:hypothetical protein
MRTYNMHNQKPLFRRKDTEIPRQEAKRAVMDALQAAIDHVSAGTLLSDQLKSALRKAKDL